ncbi:MAG: tRNA uracil 4-sulfurtransferase ThiI [Candidatus Altiarchaeia archaeon]
MAPLLRKEQTRCVIVRYGEIALKQGNRRRFEDVLMGNIRRQLDYMKISYGSVHRISGRFVVESDDQGCASVVSKVFGVSSASNAVRTGSDMDAMKETALSFLKDNKPASFRISARRLEKPSPYSSRDINYAVGEYLANETGCIVDLDEPALELFIDYTKKASYVHVGRIHGPGGLPVGVSGRAAVFLSGGIDSPVAAYLAMRRGLVIILVHFLHGKNKPAKIGRIHCILKEYCPDIRLLYVPMEQVEKEIIINAPAEYRIIILRRSFMRIAGILAGKYRYKAVVSGDNIGQVASQTIDNSTVIGMACPNHWIKPLECANKEEIIELAKKIGTYEESIKEYSDCCSFMVPRHPATSADLKRVEEIESLIPLKVFADAALGAFEVESDV